jgi:hypothetical protein
MYLKPIINPTKKMKHISLLIFAVLFALVVMGQDAQTMAKATYLVAEEAYSSGNFQRAYDKLIETEKHLGQTNSKIEYLKVKSLMELKEFTKAKTALSKYFDTVKDKESEKYNEMLQLLGSIDDLEKQSNGSKVFKKNTTILIQAIDSMVKKCYYFMQDNKRIKRSKLISVTLDYKNATVKTLYQGSIYKNNEYSNDLSIRDIKEIYAIPSISKTYEIEITYNTPCWNQKRISERVI